MKEVERVMREVFAVPEAGRPYRVVSPSDPTVDDYVDALGDPIRPDSLFVRTHIRSSEEVWGVEATRIAQSWIEQAGRFREWALE